MWDKIKKSWDMEVRTKYFIHVLICLFVASVLFFGLLIMAGKSLSKEAVATTETPNAFEGINLDAKSAVVWDVVNSRELFSKNPYMPLPLASLTKVLTAVMAREKLGESQKIQITEKDLEPEGDSNLAVGDTWQAKDLRDFTLLTSSNDGAFALAAVMEAGNNSTENQFIKEMNDTASKIGLSNSKFFNEHGLDREADKGGAYGSAMDMAVLFEYTLKNYPEVLEATRYKSIEFKSDKKTYASQNTNTIIDEIPNVIASKTGFTDLAGGNLAVAFDAGLNRPIIISVLGSTEEGRFSDMLQLVEASMKYISR